jgi:omega-amidase
MRKKLKVALVSLNQKWLDKKANMEECTLYIKQAKNNRCDIVVFPEMTLTGFAPDNFKIIENRSDSKTLKWFGEISGKYRINIFFGACLKYSGQEKPFNMLCLARDNGCVAPVYAKTHLFSYGQEEKYYIPGNQIKAQEIQGIKFGFGICYDLRFSEHFLALANCSNIVIIIANWPTSRIKHWNCLLRARAIEEQIIIIGVNRTGSDGNGLEYTESSDIYDSNGNKLKYNQKNSIKIYEIEEQHFTANIPTFDDKKIEVYKDFL